MTVPAETPPEERKIGPLVWVSLITPIIFVIALLAYEIISPIKLSITNHSDQPLTDITVSIQKHELAVPNIGPGQTYELWFRNQRETDAYTLRAKLGDDTKIEEKHGELRSGMIHGFYGPVKFTVEEDGTISFLEN